MAVRNTPQPPKDIAQKQISEQLKKDLQQDLKVKPDKNFQQLLVGPQDRTPVAQKVVNRQLKAGSANAVSAPLKSATGVDVSKMGAPTQPDVIKRVVTDLVDGQKKLDKIIQDAMSGRNFSSQELLAIQASVYRFSQELELTSKVIEKATSGLKQMMNTQL